MIVGNDVSKYQGDINFEVYKNNSNFLIAKCSEGVGYVDPKFQRNKAECRRVALPFGSYHFARPDLGNTPQAEANFYLASVGDLVYGDVLCLDYEPDWNGDAVGWCHDFLKQVEAKTGVKALIYLNQSQVKGFNWKPVVDDGFGLWIAAYTYDPNKNTFVTGAWKFAVMQQWTNKQSVPGIVGTVDGDVFFGDADAFKKYGYQGIPTTPPPISDKYNVVHKGETIATYDYNPADKLAETSQKLSDCQQKVSDQASENAQLTLALQQQETDNANLQGNIRDCQLEKDTALADKARLTRDLDKANADLTKALADLKECNDTSLKKCICKYSRTQLLKWGLFGKPAICN